MVASMFARLPSLEDVYIALNATLLNGSSLFPIWPVEFETFMMPSLRQIVPAFLLASSSLSSPLEPRDLNSFILKERPTALQGILNNIGPDGKLSQGAASGVVIASPSTVNPDYLYTWTRDSALTMKTVVDEFIAGNKALEQTIKNYIKAQAIQQTLTNPSGNFLSGAGLGEPKYLISLARFNGAWGRPQRDGPALRAIALMY